MTAALGTLVFLSLLWLLAVVGSMVVEQSGGKILAALKGRSASMPVQTATVQIRYRPRSRPVMRATPRMRVAA